MTNQTRAVAVLLFACTLTNVPAQEIRLALQPDMVINEAEVGDPGGLVDEQEQIIGPPAGKPSSIWQINSRHNKSYPYSAHIDLGTEKNLSTLWLYDTHNKGDVVISAGTPGAWREVASYDCGRYMHWARIPLDVTSRYLRLTRMTPGAQFTEIAIYEHTPDAHRAMLERKAAEAKARAEREAALARARAEMKKRPLVELGAPFGKAYLVDEIDCGMARQEHGFVEDPAGASRVEDIFGRPCRVLRKTAGECAYISYRVGGMKLLQPGAAYVLSVEYPEDVPRSMVIMNGGNECSRGIHTGNTFGDALHAKYVASNSESLETPLSGKYETWNSLFFLHDRFPDREFLRGDKERPLSPEDGFTVTIAQFSPRNIPASRGAAVSRIRLLAIPEPERLYLPPTLPPGTLPHRHVFWREEMADGIIGGKKNARRGIAEPLDWYRHKARLMRFLGMNTFSKDLLEFGACQHWDSTDGGGNAWVYFNSEHKDLWGQIVVLMGENGFNVLPYYEYSGSKGQKGLGFQRRAKPLTRDDAYTHIKWIESANADITDPDTYDDFKKMLDHTIVRHRAKARFVGAWLRPRSQLPIGFGDSTRARFAKEANGGKPLTRDDLKKDKELLGRYYDWWYGKRRQFLESMRDHLRNAGVNPEAVILFTAVPGEPGVSFPSWDPVVVTDDTTHWQPIMTQDLHKEGERFVNPVHMDDVVAEHRYLQALLAERLNWGGWEVSHASPPSDPQRYKDCAGVLLSHCFNRAYTVADPATFEAFRGPSGLFIVRHYALNENMMFDRNDENKLGYFVADVERTGPYCMLAEAWAVARGDPWYIGYLAGNSFNRGYPEYVRRFNRAFLALPALPSEILRGACADPEIVVRRIPTPAHGTYYALVNTGLTAKQGVVLRLGNSGTVTDVVAQQAIPGNAGVYRSSFHPCELKTWNAERK
jgi:hypothetical protein